MQRREIVYLAGGCFWGMQFHLRRIPGVLCTWVGYVGGTRRGDDGASPMAWRDEAEAVEVVFDPEALYLRDLLKVFFQIHDPTMLNRQCDDRGTKYRSAIFWTKSHQVAVASRLINDVQRSGLWPGQVVTQLLEAGRFSEAAPAHQDYLERHPGSHSCHYPRQNWRLPDRAVA